MDSIKNEIKEIKKRNERVELDKAWETSYTRKIAIVILTYLVVVIFFFSANLPKPFINSIVPSLAFTISTLTLPWFKIIWEKGK
jgi:hypothetical protein